jgi:hypothetical protein
MTILENRASVVLYNFLISNKFYYPFLLPSNVCPIVPSSFIKANVAFEFVDIDNALSINKEHVMNKLSRKRYSGICFVHAYGKLYDTDTFFRDLKALDDLFCIIDDRCLCIPDLSFSKPNFSDLTLYSTGYSKYVEIGKGGWGILNDSYSYKMTTLKYKEDDYIEFLKGHRFCLDNNTRYALPESNWLDSNHCKMDTSKYFNEVKIKLEQAQIHKGKLNSIYRNNLPKKIQLGEEFSNWRFSIIVDNRKEILEAIFREGLFAGTNYPSISNMFKGQTSPFAESFGQNIINLFNSSNVDELMARKLCRVINNFIAV